MSADVPLRHSDSAPDMDGATTSYWLVSLHDGEEMGTAHSRVFSASKGLPFS